MGGGEEASEEPSLRQQGTSTRAQIQGLNWDNPAAFAKSG